MQKFIVFLLLIVSLSCKTEQKKQHVAVQPNAIKSSALLKQFQYQLHAKPIISVHRGGKGIKNYPENCLETLKYINDSIEAIYEIDVAKTNDNVLVLMHDNTLDRTTTGTGKITDYTFEELQSYNLVDDFGNETTFKIPLFKDVLHWAKTNNVVLTIDIKRGVAVEQVVGLIRDLKAEDVSIIITYDLRQAEQANAAAPELLLSVSARNDKEVDWLLHSGIPTDNMLAFTGTRLSQEALYARLHNYGIKTILGTLGNLDKQAEVRGDTLYTIWHKKGIDVFATDRPFAAAAVLHN